MAQFTITIPDAIVPRIQAAFRHVDGFGRTVPASLNMIEGIIRQYIKKRVRDYEANIFSDQKAQEIDKESW